jgi:hypothetical protein
MAIKQRAVIDKWRNILCQAIISRNVVLVPLHVIDYRTAATLLLLDADGTIEEVAVAEVLTIDFHCDILAIRTERSRGGPEPTDVVLVEEIGIEVEVRAIVNWGGTPALTVCRMRIRDVVCIERHTYRSASGRMAVARDVRALFLTDPFPPGWSGAPVLLLGTSHVVGFVHGNAPANEGAGVCLVPREGGVVLRCLRLHTGIQDAH